MSLKPITIYGHASGPNPWKVDALCRELDIPYETTYMDMADLKKPPYEAKNPNGRVPAIYDPNTDLTLWEVRENS
jgi:glutathione S-transferase